MSSVNLLTPPSVEIRRGTGDEDGRITFEFPYDDDLRAEFKARLRAAGGHDTYRWRDPVWSVAAAYADVASACLITGAAQRGWPVYDHTTEDDAAIADRKASALLAAEVDHEAKVLAVLAEITAYQLAIVGWRLREDQVPLVEVEVGGYLGRPLFRRLMACTVIKEGAFVRMVASFLPKRSGRPGVTLIATPAILRALLECTVEYAKLEPLTMVEVFDDGVGHFNDTDGNLWLGARYDMVCLTDWETSHASWHFTELDGMLYAVEPAAQQATLLLRSPQRWLRLGGPVARPLPTTSQVVAWFTQFHAENWLHGWLRAQVTQTTVRPNPFSATPLNNPKRYVHPADAILDHALKTHSRAVLTVMGMGDNESIAALAQRLTAQKLAAARAYVDDRKQQALALAAPKLAKLTKAELSALADQFGIAVPKGAKKQTLVEAVSRQDVAEYLIGQCSVEIPTDWAAPAVQPPASAPSTAPADHAAGLDDPDWPDRVDMEEYARSQAGFDTLVLWTAGDVACAPTGAPSWSELRALAATYGRDTTLLDTYERGD